ncbi:MAG: CocE/NonD family hydrolase [Chloroflexota bacterium]
MRRTMRLPRLLVLILATLVGVSSSRVAQAQTASTTTVDHNTMVAMRDGIRLATDVYRPTGPGTYPVILTRTPYDKTGSKDDGNFFAQNGYVYVAQDTRGRYASEGTFDIYVQDDTDGFDAAAWLTSQSWFSPDKGFSLYGGSYLASTALSAALTDPPYLKAMYLYIASSNYHQDGAWRGGAFALAHNAYFADVTICPNQIARQAQAGAPDTARAPLPSPKDLAAILKLEESTPIDEHLLSQNCPWYRDWAMNEQQNWYWNQPGYNHEPLFDHFPKVPVALLGGWYDQFLGGTVIDYQAAADRTGQPVSLTLGPWIHGRNDQSTAGQGLFGADARVDQRAEALHWFNRYMRGGDPVAPKPGVRYFLMGGGSGKEVKDDQGFGHLDIGGMWQTAPAWPLPNTEQVPYYLHADGSLGPLAPFAEQPPTDFAYDARQPVPTIGGNISSGDVLAPAGAYDQRCRPEFPICHGSSEVLAARPDVLVYQTDPLDADRRVVGQVTVDLWAATSAVDTDFTAKLVDVYPDGTAINVADGILRARYREDPRIASLLTPGEPSMYPIDLWHTALTFKAGHRIRLDISSSNFPHFDRNLNTGNPIGSDSMDQAVVANQSVYQDASHPSRVLLPMQP